MQDKEGDGATRALWALILGNFLIGTGVMLPAGMLNALSDGFAVAPATTGLLLLTGGLVVGFGAPVFAALTNGIDRRLLLVAALALYAVGHAASALAPSFGVLLALRAVTIIGAAIFTPQAAAAAGLIVPPERRASAIAFIFLGWSAASVAGTPMGAYLSATIGWQAVFACMAVLSALGAWVVWRALPARLIAPRLDLAAWRQALTSPVVLCVLLVTILSMSGQFTIFGYFAPIMTEGFGVGPGAFSLTLVLLGVSGIAGNLLASRLVGVLGTERAIAVALAALILGFALFTLGFGSTPMALAAGCLWGLGTFSSNSLQQSRLVTLAPDLASATVALNTSAVYLGQAIGAAAGGIVIGGGVSPVFGLVALAFAVAALGASLAAGRLARGAAT